MRNQEVFNDLCNRSKKGSWQVVLGLEVHAQISSKSKLFSVASTDWGSDPNTQVELADWGMPGALPVVALLCRSSGSHWLKFEC